MGASKPVREGSASPKPVMEGGGSVNTHTGSVSVAGSQSNIVKAATDPVEPKDSLKSEAKPGGEQIYQGKNSGLGYPHVWWRGSGWKSSQGSKPSMGPDLDKSSSIPACVRPGENDSLRLTSDASLVAGPCPTYDVPGDNATMDKPSRSLADRSLGEKDSLAATSDASLVASLSPTSDVHGDDDSLGANSEVSLGGRGCVNTQTGSVSVAGSQSNIVYNVCSENVRKNSVQIISGLDDPKPNDVRSKTCMSVAQLARKYNSKYDDVCTCDQQVNCVCPLEARRPVIGRRRSSTNSYWTRKPSVYTDSSSNSKMNFSARTNFSVSEPGNSTPIKRKLWRESRIKDLISTYDEIAQVEGESPAKRARYQYRGHKPNNQ